MDSPTYPVGTGSTAVKSKYINGTLVFNRQVLTPGVVAVKRVRVTTAQVNAGYEILPAIPGFGYRIVDCDMIAYGGNAATATSVDILGTKGASASRPVVNAVAGLTQSARLRMGATNSTILADGASFTTHDANTGLSVTKQSGGSNLATATGIDVQISYVVEPA